MTWTRTDHRSRLDDEPVFDVAVIGGGVVGAGAALDAASRGLRTVLIEREDYAWGTSSRSTKMFHGGIRYLPQFQFGLVAEGLIEQKTLQRTASYLYKPLEFLTPMIEGTRVADLPSWATHPAISNSAFRLGLIAYDTLGLRGFGKHHRYSAEEFAEALPLLRTEGLTGGFGYLDAQTDDSRLTIQVLKTAVRQFDATAINHASVVSSRRQNGTWELGVRDHLGNEDITIRTRSVVAATGPKTPPVDDHMKLRLSSGVHLVVDAHGDFPDDRGVLLPETEDGRVMYVIPWVGKLLVGTTDVQFGGDPMEPLPSDDEVEYLIRHYHRYFDAPSTEVLSSWVGYRALKDEGGSTAQVSRESVIEEVQPGFVQVAGGKLTTYRRIAAKAVDKLDSALGSFRKSATGNIPLTGSGDQPAGVSDALFHGYGTEASHVLALGDSLLSDGITPKGIAHHAALEEGAVTIADIALRRSHLSWFVKDHGRGDAEFIANELASAHGWDDSRVATELSRFEDDLAREGL
ncbi:MAG: glycerol-3-phosphate dehydrogenase/oxidase [Acidimicrobiia bacterium]|nr:glycerol-3-phosphate dehydrogenase/oxidase [Acidimicrobiia bacterium]